MSAAAPVADAAAINQADLNQAAAAMAADLKSQGLSVDEITTQLKNKFDPTAVANALKDTFNMSVAQVTDTMKQAGYTGEDVAFALKTVFVGATQDIASAVRSAYGWTADLTARVLQAVGFEADQIGNAFKSLGGDFASVGKSILDSI